MRFVVFKIHTNNAISTESTIEAQRLEFNTHYRPHNRHTFSTINLRSTLRGPLVITKEYNVTWLHLARTFEEHTCKHVSIWLLPVYSIALKGVAILWDTTITVSAAIVVVYIPRLIIQGSPKSSI